MGGRDRDASALAGPWPYVRREQVVAARKTVAVNALGVDDAAELLDMLGIGQEKAVLHPNDRGQQDERTGAA